MSEKTCPYVILSKKIRVILSKNKKNATFLKKILKNVWRLKKYTYLCTKIWGKYINHAPENNKKELNINIININNN